MPSAASYQDNKKKSSVNKKKSLLYPRKFFNRAINVDEVNEIPYLIAMQLRSYNDFLQKDVPLAERKNIGMESIFRSIFPIVDSRATIEYIGYELGEPKYDAREAQQRGVNYAAPLMISLRMVIWAEDEAGNREVNSIKEQVVYMSEIPLMTENGTFIINGSQRVIVSQMHRSPGVFYFRDDGKNNAAGKYIYSARVIPYYGSWLDIEYDARDAMFFRVDKKRKMLLSTLLYAIGLTREDIFKTFYETKEYIYQDNRWVTKFDVADFAGQKVSYDVVDCDSGEVLIKADTRVTPRVVNNLKERNSFCFAEETDILDHILANDLVIIDDAGSKRKVEVGTSIDQETLEYVKSHKKKIAIICMGGTKRGPYLHNTVMLDKNTSKADALMDIYRVMRPGEQFTLESAEKALHMTFFDPERYDLSYIGRMKINIKHDLEIPEDVRHLRKEDVIAIVGNLLDLRDGNGEVDDIDSLANRRVRSVGELIENQFRLALLRIERSLIERMGAADVDTVMLHDLINSRALSSVINEFFGTSQLSQFMDQTNPLAELTHKRRISSLGPGGLTRERASFAARDVHPTHYNRICPIETPEGQNIGLINSLATYARVNKYGFIETPYMKIENRKVTGEIQYLSAIEEQKYLICPSNIRRDEDNYILDDHVICRRNGDFVSIPAEEAAYMDLAPIQVVSVAASLIPFLEHNDANRALMGANMQRQAVPLIRQEAPFVGTGTESVVARNSDAVILAAEAGVVSQVDANRIVVTSVTAENQPRVKIYSLIKYQKSNHNTSLNQVPIVDVGDRVEAGDILADGSCTERGELALGKNLLVAFMPWNGYNFEDSILISEKMVREDALTSLHIQQYEIVARDTRLGPEEITRSIPNIPEESLLHLDEDGIVHIGATVKSGDVIVGKVIPKSESLLTPEEKLLRAIFGEKAAEVKDASLRIPPGEGGTVIGVRIFTRRGVEKNERAIALEQAEIERHNRDSKDKEQIVEDFVRENVEKILIGKILVSGVKGVATGSTISDTTIRKLHLKALFSIVVEDNAAMAELLALRTFYEENMEKIAATLKSKIEKLQAGDDLPQGALKVIKVYVATKLKIQPGDKMAGRHGNKGVVSKIVPIEDMPFLEDGTPVDIVLNPIGVPSRMNIGQILETHLGWASANLGKKIGKMVDHYYEANNREILQNLREELVSIYSGKSIGKNSAAGDSADVENGASESSDKNKKLKNVINSRIADDIATIGDKELLGLAKQLERGLPFATPIFSGATEDDIDQILEGLGYDKSGQVKLIDGRTGEYFDRPVTVGYIYMLKLDHLVHNKMHMRSIGPYSLVTQQPLGGRSHFGGQRFGEMECWALEAYGAAYTLQELLTVKSDDVRGRIDMYDSIVRGYCRFQANIPESFYVMVMEMRALALDMKKVSLLNNDSRPAGEEDSDTPEIKSLDSFWGTVSDPSTGAYVQDMNYDYDSAMEDARGSREVIAVSLASPETIEKVWSYGEVKLPDTVNYRTTKPERGGLFCASIFGPIKDYECLCGKYKRMKYRGVICEKCGVEVTTSKKRRRRMAHIKLAAPVVHIWFLRSLPSRIATLLDISLKDIERVMYFDIYIVSEPGLSHFQYGQLITEEEYSEALDQYGEGTFEAGMGAATIRQMLANFDLEENRVLLREELIQTSSEMKRKKIVRRLKLIEDFIESNVRPEWMVLTVLPVIPPDLRPLVMLDGGRFATSDLNELYRRVINRNNRLKRLLELKAPEVIIRNEMRMLQESVDALLDNGRKTRSLMVNKRPLKSLADMLKGKQGRFRQNLLGKRVDYSGRSVIIVGPHLRLHQCGLPKKMALELFKPFIYAKLEKYGIAVTIKAAKKMVEMERPEVWDVLAEVIKDHPVLLNRAPTLHRLGIQAFEPVLIEGKAIQLHPLVCAAFNADFDGDQMAVHVPLSIEAQIEARVLMMSTKNILSPANGRPIVVPSQDMIFGLYYLTMELPNQPGEGRLFCDFPEIEHAIFSDQLSIHARIKCRYEVIDVDGRVITRVVETTAGRLILAEALPENCKVRFDQINKQINKKEVSNLIEMVYRSSGQKATVEFADNIMQLGFKYACRSGISFSKEDMVIPPTKQKHITEAQDEVVQYESQYADGLITFGERYNKVVDTWSRCTELIGADVSKYIALNKEGKPVQGVNELNSIFMMADSGARGSAAQLRQLTGMRGLMTKPSGEIIEMPIISNFREGLSVHEYFTSTHGTRKGLADTALKTANSGYLTRKLVDVSQDCIVIADDCGTERHLLISGVMENGEMVVSLSERVLGRVSSSNIYYPISNQMIVAAGEIIDEKTVEILEEAGIESVKIRSPLMCDIKGGVCAKCYGRDLSSGKMVKVGTAVGIIAAQSIGEPGTQLTMRTFHIGGAAQKSSTQSNAIAAHSGIIRLSHKNIVVDSRGSRIMMSRNCEAIVTDEAGCEIVRYKLPYGSTILVDEYEHVRAGTKIAEWDPFTIPIITEKSGLISLVDLIKDVSIKEISDEITGMASYVVIESRGGKKGSAELRPSIILKGEDGSILTLSNGLDAKYYLPVNAILSVKDGAQVSAGDIIARIPKGSSKSRDITGGLPRVVELFEARQPKDHSLISEIDGYVEFGKDYKSKRRVIVRSEHNSEQFVEYFVARGHNITAQEGDYVKKGDLLMEGFPSPHEILRIMGIEALAKHITDEVQQVYRLQGVTINDRHIEVIIRQMLRKVEITDPKGTTFLIGEQVNREEFEEVNQKTINLGYEPAECIQILQGITKSSLQTTSFLSAASFQETTRVITDAALSGRIDRLRGLKENVIVGRLIPAGAGYCFMNLKDQAVLKDNEIKESLRKEMLAKLAENKAAEAAAAAATLAAEVAEVAEMIDGSI